MKYVDEYRDLELAKKISKEIEISCTKPWTIMEVCGGQTHTILRYGIQDLLPEGIDLVHGPGCPVCVTPVQLIDKAVSIAARPEVILCTFGDMLRVPGTHEDLLTVKAKGGDVRIVYSPLDAVKLAKNHPEHKVVFFAVGFETTAPANAMAIKHARVSALKNFFVLSAQVLVPPVCSMVLSEPDCRVQALIGPGHVCTVTGLEQYEQLSKQFSIPIVVAGFEPIDLLQALSTCVKRLESQSPGVVNQYSRAVDLDGNHIARDVVNEVFSPCDREWRALGVIPRSGLGLSDLYSSYDAEKEFPEIFSHETGMSTKSCISDQILLGNKKPPDCPEFGKSCTPETPIGATMVSVEGTCSNYFKFKNH
jgi:hydrogenase expression/formation protein HypD